MVKHLKIFFSSTKKAFRLNLGIQPRGLKVYQLCLNDETRMTIALLWFGEICVPVAVAILEDCCIAFANMQVSELWPMDILLMHSIF